MIAKMHKRQSLPANDSNFLTEENQQDQTLTNSAAKFPARSTKVHRLNIRVKESGPAAFRFVREKSPVLSPWVQGLSKQPSLELIRLEAAQPALSRDLTPVLETGQSRDQQSRNNPQATTQVAGKPDSTPQATLNDRT